MASGHGLTEFDGRLDDLSAAAFQARRQRSAAWRDRFRAVSDASLRPDERIDRDLVVSILTGRAVMAEWEAWRRQPEIYVSLGLQGVFGLFLHRLRAEPALVRDAVSRLRAIPEPWSTGGATSRRSWWRRCSSTARSARREPARATSAPSCRPRRESPSLRAALAEAGAVAAVAFDGFASFLEELRERATGGFALGESRYSRLLRDKELIPLDAGALRERGRAEYERLSAELRELPGAWPARATGPPCSSI